MSTSKLEMIGGLSDQPYPDFNIPVVVNGREKYRGNSWSPRYVADCVSAVREGEKYNRLIRLSETCDLSYSVYEDSPILDNLHNKLINGDTVTYHDWYYIYRPEILLITEEIKDVLSLKGRLQTLYQTIRVGIDLAVVLYYDVLQQYWYAYYRDADLNVSEFTYRFKSAESALVTLIGDVENAF